MLDITIKGGCATREAFNYQKLLGKENFHISNYIFRKPTAVLGSNKITNIKKDTIDKLKLELTNTNSVRDFDVRQLDSSFSKNFFKEVNAGESYFIFDLIAERMNLIAIADSFVEYKPGFVDTLKKMGINFQVVKNTKDIFLEYIDRFMHLVEEKYEEENIILHKAYAISTTKINNTLYPLTSTFADPRNKKVLNAYSVKRALELNSLYMEMYDYIEQNYPKIKVIELPIENYFSPCNHKYGRGFFHYNDEYYIDFLNALEQLLIYKNPLNNSGVSKENRKYIYDSCQKQKIISNICNSNFMTRISVNPDELMYGELNTPIRYNVNTGGQALIKSYLLKDSSPGVLIYNSHGQLIGKLVLNKFNEVVRIYTLYKNEAIESITYMNEGKGIKTNLFDELSNDISDQGKVQVSYEGLNQIYSFYNDINKIILKVIKSTKSRQQRIIFYEDKHICRVINFSENRIDRIIKYDDEGEIDEEFNMGEFINIGKVQVKLRYDKNKKKIRYMFFATGDLQSKTYFSEDEHYIKTEYFNAEGNVVKEIHYNESGRKSKFVHHLSSSKKVVDYFESGASKSISYYDNEEKLLKSLARNSESEPFIQLNRETIGV